MHRHLSRRPTRRACSLTPLPLLHTPYILLSCCCPLLLLLLLLAVGLLLLLLPCHHTIPFLLAETFLQPSRNRFTLFRYHLIIFPLLLFLNSPSNTRNSKYRWALVLRPLASHLHHRIYNALALVPAASTATSKRLFSAPRCELCAPGRRRQRPAKQTTNGDDIHHHVTKPPEYNVSGRAYGFLGSSAGPSRFFLSPTAWSSPGGRSEVDGPRSGLLRSQRGGYLHTSPTSLSILSPRLEAEIPIKDTLAALPRTTIRNHAAAADRLPRCIPHMILNTSPRVINSFRMHKNRAEASRQESHGGLASPIRQSMTQGLYERHHDSTADERGRHLGAKSQHWEEMENKFYRDAEEEA